MKIKKAVPAPFFLPCKLTWASMHCCPEAALASSQLLSWFPALPSLGSAIFFPLRETAPTGWPQTCCVAEGDLEQLLILPSAGGVGVHHVWLPTSCRALKVPTSCMIPKSTFFFLSFLPHLLSRPGWGERLLHQVLGRVPLGLAKPSQVRDQRSWHFLGACRKCRTQPHPGLADY